MEYGIKFCCHLDDFMTSFYFEKLLLEHIGYPTFGLCRDFQILKVPLGEEAKFHSEPKCYQPKNVSFAKPSLAYNEI